MDSDERRLALERALEYHATHRNSVSGLAVTPVQIVDTAEKFLAFLTGSTASVRRAPSRRASKARRA